MPYNKQFKMWHHLSATFSVEGIMYDFIACTTSDKGETIDHFQNQKTKQIHQVNRNYFIDKDVTYYKNGKPIEEN